jgi:hypothetical protein
MACKWRGNGGSRQEIEDAEASAFRSASAVFGGGWSGGLRGEDRLQRHSRDWKFEVMEFQHASYAISGPICPHRTMGGFYSQALRDAPEVFQPGD